MELIYSPHWFYGKDIVIDIISVVVLALIGGSCLGFYKVKKNKNMLSLAASFFIIASSFIFKILMNFTVYYSEIKTKQVGWVTFTYETIQSTDTLFFIGFLAYRVLTLAGLYLLYITYSKNKSTSLNVLTLYFILALMYYSRDQYLVFHFTALMLLSFITYRYLRLYRKNNTKQQELLLASFGTIALSHLLFIFIRFSKMFYAAAEGIQLVGYIMLLATFIIVLKHGKKKKQIRHN